MNTRPPDAVYNLTRRALLNDKLTVSDCASQPLKMLSLVVTGLGLDSESALWLYPLHAAPGLPRVFPFDLLYLDKDYRVLETAEIAPGVEFPSYRADVASALVVPQHTLSSTGTKKGDRLMICSEKELQALLAKTGDSGRADNVVVSPVPSVAASPAERLSPVAQNSVPALAKPPVPGPQAKNPTRGVFANQCRQESEGCVRPLRPADTETARWSSRRRIGSSRLRSKPLSQAACRAGVRRDDGL